MVSNFRFRPLAGIELPVHWSSGLSLLADVQDGFLVMLLL